MLSETTILKNYAIKIVKTIVMNAANIYIGFQFKHTLYFKKNIRFLVMEQNIVRIIFNALNTFKENDEIFQYLYNYKDTIPNFSFLEDCLNTLIIILEKGSTLGAGNTNQFISYFDLDCLEKLKTCLSSLCEKDKENKIFFKKNIIYKNRSLSVNILWVLYKIIKLLDGEIDLLLFRSNGEIPNNFK